MGQDLYRGNACRGVAKDFGASKYDELIAKTPAEPRLQYGLDYAEDE